VAIAVPGEHVGSKNSNRFPGASAIFSLCLNRLRAAWTFLRFHRPSEEATVDVLARPFVRLWNYIEQVGGFPGQVFFICAIILGAIGIATWFSNKR
jgi:hypothetical protein